MEVAGKLVTEDEVYRDMSWHISKNEGKLVLCSLSASSVTGLVRLFRAIERGWRILILDAFIAAILEVCRPYAVLPKRGWIDDIRILCLPGNAELVDEASTAGTRSQG